MYFLKIVHRIAGALTAITNANARTMAPVNRTQAIVNVKKDTLGNFVRIFVNLFSTV